MYKKLKSKPSPFGQWLLDYTDSQDMSLTELGRQSGLTVGALRSLIVFPERTPELETCIRLSAATGKPVRELLDLAGVTSPDKPEDLHPDRFELLQIYDGLPGPLRLSLVELARGLRTAIASVGTHPG